MIELDKIRSVFPEWPSELEVAKVPGNWAARAQAFFCAARVLNEESELAHKEMHARVGEVLSESTPQKDFFWGTHMWVPVYCLLNALLCAHTRLTKDQCVEYMKRLAIPDKHQSTIVEMIPGHKVDPEVQVQFEVPGVGIGNKTMDWVIGPCNDRTVRIDVKRRSIDFIKQAEKIVAESEAPEPDHDSSNRA